MLVRPSFGRQRMDAFLFISGIRPLDLLIDAYYGELAASLRITGIISDDPENQICWPHRRFWRFREFNRYRTLIPDLARYIDPDVFLFTGSVRSPEFEEAFCERLQPSVCLMAGFGQRIPKKIFAHSSVRMFVNSHASVPSSDAEDARPQWPSDVSGGAQPWEGIFTQLHGRATIVGYQIDEGLDTGREVLGWSEYFDYPLLPDPLSAKHLGSRVLMMHRKAAPYTLQMFRNIFRGRVGQSPTAAYPKRPGAQSAWLNNWLAERERNLLSPTTARTT